MRILIGTPIHISKDYCIERWLENVSQVQKQYPSDLLIVDNSQGISFVKKVEKLCIKRGIKNYKIEHFEIDQSLGTDIRIERSQEIIRQYILSHDYDTWFSWECDQIIPVDALNTLVHLMETGNFMMVIHDSKARWDPSILNTNMGITLIKRVCLKKGWFLPKRGGKISLSLADTYNIHETIFKKRVLNAGGNFIEVFGMINPIYHLNN